MSTFLATGVFQGAFSPFTTTAGVDASANAAFVGPTLVSGGNFFTYILDWTVTFSAGGTVNMQAWRSSGGSDFSVHAGSWMEVARLS
jgi:hypothetical protein